MVATARGNATRAVSLFEASESLYGNLRAGIYVSPSENAWIEPHLAYVQAQLDDPTLAKLRQEVRAMTLEEVVAFGLK